MDQSVDRAHKAPLLAELARRSDLNRQEVEHFQRALHELGYQGKNQDQEPAVDRNSAAPRPSPAIATPSTRVRPIPYITFDQNGVILDINLTARCWARSAIHDRISRSMRCRRLDRGNGLDHIRRCRASEGAVTSELTLRTVQGPIQVQT